MHQLFQNQDVAPDRSRRSKIERWAYLSRAAVSKFWPVMPSGIDREDAIAVGHVALIRAVDTFDSSRGVKFETYAMSLIRGVLCEMIREADWVPRSVRAKEKMHTRVRNSLIARGIEPTHAALCQEMGVTDDVLRVDMAALERMHVSSLDEAIGESAATLSDMIHDAHADTFEICAARVEAQHLWDAVACLPHRERFVMEEHYASGQTFNLISKTLNVSESRTRELHGQAVRRLRRNLSSFMAA
jgi:RNA polymerase sigma factor for flagellar operon FliA